MPLTTGSRLGPYEILGAIGAGGMGEVYRARDTRLDRTVAVKVLPTHLSEHPELRQRFEREARAISSLSHPHICTLHDVGRENGVDFLVMEHLEGETLALRLTRGPLPTDQVLKFGLEIAGALEAAHRQAIVHRDLKPGNIMITKSGVKLLDFGLAKTAAGPASGASADALTSLPTEALGGAPLTTEGTLLGTFQYMAPEQLEGKEADARTDLFAFGAVLYEMATARPAFSGKSRASLISAIMSSDPAPISSVQPLTPPALDRVVKTCLAKDPDDRWQTAHDVALQLEWIAEGGSQAGLPAPVAARRRSRERLSWIVAGVAALSTVALGAFVLMNPAAKPMTMRFSVPAARTMTFMDAPRVSPDGRTIAVNATDSAGVTRIWIRPLGTQDYEPLPGTEGARRPFWSPDSRYIGFAGGGKIKKVAISGGPPQALCDSPNGSDGSWSRDGLILFDGAGQDPIRRVSAAGGVPTDVLPADSGSVGWPMFLPDGKHFLFMISDKTAGAGDLCVGTLGSKVVRHLGVRGSRVEYSAPGYLLFVRDRTLLAQPFDAGRLRVTGEPIPVADPVGTAQGGALGFFSVSGNGVLIYTQGGAGNNHLVWLDRTGRALGQVGPTGDILNPTLSPDGKLIAVRISDPQTSNRDVWILDPARGTSTRFTFDPANDNLGVWSADGSRLIYPSNGSGVFNLYQKLASGAGAAESLLATPNDKYPTDVTKDGRYLAYIEANPVSQLDIGILPLFGDRKPIVFLKTPFSEYLARFSPDGHWIAYDSDESGRGEIYVQPFPGPGGKWQVSTGGGGEPVWRADGTELFYLGPGNKLMSVDVKLGATFEAGVPKALFEYTSVPAGWFHYAPTADGQRFLFVSPERNAAIAATTVVLNWDAEIGKK